MLISGPAGQLDIVVETTQNTMFPVSFIMCHPHPLQQGTMNNKVVTTMSRMFARLGVHAVRFNYRGVGQSTGSYGGGLGETEDLLAVVDWVRKHYPSHQIWLGGFSFGCFVAYNACEQIGAQQLITIAPAIESMDFSPLVAPTVPWTVVVPDADEVVDAKITLHWLADHQSSYHLLKMQGVSHFLHGQLIHLRDALIPLYQARLP